MSQILAILNCYTPGTGANVAQVVTRSDGSVEFHGDEAIGRHHLGKIINSPLAAASLTPRISPKTAR